MRWIREPGSLPSLVVHGVDDAPPTEQFQPRLNDLGFGRVQHDGQSRGRRKDTRQSLHVSNTVTTDVVDTEIEKVGAIAGLVLRNLDAVVDAPSTIASRNAFDPFALVRSPIDRYVASCWKGTAW